jgi:hypothetical protein
VRRTAVRAGACRRPATELACLWCSLSGCKCRLKGCPTRCARSVGRTLVRVSPTLLSDESAIRRSAAHPIPLRVRGRGDQSGPPVRRPARHGPPPNHPDILNAPQPIGWAYSPTVLGSSSGASTPTLHRSSREFMRRRARLSSAFACAVDGAARVHSMCPGCLWSLSISLLGSLGRLL